MQILNSRCTLHSEGIIILLSLLLLPNLSLSGSDASSSCPRKCQCIWRDSKITVDCSDQTLTAIPAEVGKNTQVLNMSGNNIPIFGRSHFSRLGLHNLQKVACTKCELGSVDSKAFLGLTNLVELDLSGNKLTEIPTEALNGEATALMGLSLRANPIEVVGAKAFHRLKYLTKLDLSECSIVSVEPGAFEGLESLQRIYLHNNKLTTISGRDIPPSLHGLSVHDNSWSCDCQLRSFRLWLTQSNVPRPVEPVCTGPRRLVGIRIQSLSLTEFACPPQLSPTSMFLTVPKGKNVSIVCRVSSDPVSQITWYFNGMPLTEEDADVNLQGGFPRASERLAEGNVEASPSSYVPIDPRTHPRVRVIRQIRICCHDNEKNSVPDSAELNTNSNDDLSEGGASGGETRSELLIHHTSASDNGTYYCQAENKAARSISNFTLHVTDRDYNPDAPTILQLRLEYFIAAAIAIIIILILILVIVAVLFVRICRSRGDSLDSSNCSDGIVKPGSMKLGSVASLGSLGGGGLVGHGSKIAPTLSAKMPKHIQMGTGFVPTARLSPDPSRTVLPQLSNGGPIILSTPILSSQPDLLTDHNSSMTLSNGKKSNVTGTTSLASSCDASYRSAMENIIHDYKQVPCNTPLIGGNLQMSVPHSKSFPNSTNDQVIIGGSLPRASWTYRSQHGKLTGIQSPMTSLGYSNLSEVPLLDQQQLLSHQMVEYPQDFGLPKTVPPRATNVMDYVQLTSQLAIQRPGQNQSWLTLPGAHQYRLESPNYFPNQLNKQMMPDEKYPEPRPNENSHQATNFNVMPHNFHSVLPKTEQSFQKYMNSLKLTNSGSKSLVLPPTHLETLISPDDQAYHSLNAPASSRVSAPTYVQNILYEDESNKVGGVPIYESIDHPGSQVQSIHTEPVEKNEQSAHSDYETLEAQDGNFIQETKVPVKVELTEAEKMDLYSKVIKRKPSCESDSTPALLPLPPTSTLKSVGSSSSSGGSPPPMESVAPSKRLRRRSTRQKSPSTIQARSTMALERLTKLLLSTPESPPDNHDSMDDLLGEIQNTSKKQKLPPIASSESSGGPTRVATTDDDDEDKESKNINQELDDAFTSLDIELNKSSK